MREKLHLKNKKQSCHLYKKFTKPESKCKSNPKIQTRLTNKIPMKIPACIVLIYLKKSGFSRQIASWGHLENALFEVPKLSA
jgi:hypothetical protein